MCSGLLLATPAVFLNLLAEAATAWDNYREEYPNIGEEEWAGLPWEVIDHGNRQEA